MNTSDLNAHIVALREAARSREKQIRDGSSFLAAMAWEIRELDLPADEYPTIDVTHDERSDTIYVRLSLLVGDNGETARSWTGVSVDRATGNLIGEHSYLTAYEHQGETEVRAIKADFINDNARSVLLSIVAETVRLATQTLMKRGVTGLRRR